MINLSLARRHGQIYNKCDRVNIVFVEYRAGNAHGIPEALRSDSQTSKSIKRCVVTMIVL